MPSSKHNINKGKRGSVQKTTDKRHKLRIKHRGNEKRKYESGAAVTYISRGQAIKKLQLSLKDFRRLCILKGVYPHEPPHKKKANKGSTEQKTWYYLKDVLFLAHEPIISKFRDTKVFLKRVTKANAKREREQLEYLEEKKPIYRLDHIVRERYPYFTDALRDVDDALCLCFLVGGLPSQSSRRLFADSAVPPQTVYLCRRLTVEFLHYVIEAKAIRKAFLSLKGTYYQADILGETVTWLTPHEQRGQKEEGADDVDWNVIGTFVEFYTTMLSFVNYKLYQSMGLHYPPQLETELKEDGVIVDFYRDVQLPKERVFNLGLPLLRDNQGVTVDDAADASNEVYDLPLEGELNEEREKQRKQIESLRRLQSLFKGCYFFLSREVPRESLTVLIRSCGGRVSWDESVAYGAPYAEADPRITHQVVDRVNDVAQKLARTYVQPQWVYDSVNAHRRLSTGVYAPGAVLPPHLSPFVDEKPGDYVPSERIDALKDDGRDVSQLVAEAPQNDATNGMSADGTKRKRKLSNDDSQKKEMAVKTGRQTKESKQLALNSVGEQQKLQEMMIPKKLKRAYTKMQHGIKRNKKEARTLATKRRRNETTTVKTRNTA